MSWLFASGHQSIGALASASVLPVNIQDWFFFRIDWFDFLAVQRTLKSLLQHHNLKTSILQCSAFFMVQLSHPHMENTLLKKIIALTRRIFVSEVMPLLFNMLSRFVIAFLPGSKCLLMSWLKSPSTVILEPKKMKPVTFSIFFPTYLPRSDGTRCLTRVWLSLWFQLPPARKSQDRGTRNTAPWGCSQQTQSAGTSTVPGPRPKCRGKKGWMWNFPSKRDSKIHRV